MNAELTAMIEAGRKAAEKRIARVDEYAEWKRQEDARVRAAHFAKLPEWMHEYTSVTGSYGSQVAIDLPGCAPIHAESRAESGGLYLIDVLEPMGILNDGDNGDNGEWHVGANRRHFSTLEEAVAFAADYGESYWSMRREAGQRNMAGITPHKDAPATPVPAPAVDAQPDPLERIADALERIANALESK